MATPTPCSALMLPPKSATSSSTASSTRVAWRRAEHVDVDVAVAEVAVEDRLRGRVEAAIRARAASAKRGTAEIGTLTSSLCGTPAAAIASFCSSR